MSASSHAAANRSSPFQIDPNIRTAQTPPSAIYYELGYIVARTKTDLENRERNSLIRGVNSEGTPGLGRLFCQRTIGLRCLPVCV